jgi:two-component system response regulator FlrC
MRLLIVGDLSGQIGAASAIARSRGAKVTQLETIHAAMDALCSGHGADIIMIDVSEDIKSLADMLIRERITLPIVACGVNADAKAAAGAIKAGAQEYIPLPPDEELIAAVLEAITEESHDVIHVSPVMKRVLSMADQIAPSDASVLITGESGTGKEVIARYIHQKSNRASKPFIAVNCAAIPDNLLESELFGHEKGAFTGAMVRRVGKFEEANTGTLLLDEISEMDVRLQAKLLRAIQEREIDRVGGSRPVPIDIRILATSNRNLLDEVQKGNFREDLYFRLNVIMIEMPPLREREGDIILIGQHFIDKYSKANGLPPRKLTDAAKTKMQGYTWKGNVRELENTMHRAVLMAQGNQIDDLAIILPETRTPTPLTPTPPAPELIGHAITQPPVHHAYSQPTTPQTYSAPVQSQPISASSPAGVTMLVGRTVADVERDLIVQTLDHCLGNRTHAANILGISIRTLRNKLHQYGHGDAEE